MSKRNSGLRKVRSNVKKQVAPPTFNDVSKQKSMEELEHMRENRRKEKIEQVMKGLYAMISKAAMSLDYGYNKFDEVADNVLKLLKEKYNYRKDGEDLLAMGQVVDMMNHVVYYSNPKDLLNELDDYFKELCLCCIHRRDKIIESY